MGVEIHALVRFGKWQMPLERELPEDQDLYCVTTALSYFGKGNAHANLGDISTAKDTQQLFEEAIGAYEADLGLNGEVIRANRHPNNVWALLGLHRCYMATARVNQARLIKPQLDIALALADKGLYASCFCAKSYYKTLRKHIRARRIY